jgi:hypothetical protein
MAGVGCISRGAHALRHEALQLSVNGAVFVGDDVPTRIGLPCRAFDFWVNGSATGTPALHRRAGEAARSEQLLLDWSTIFELRGDELERGITDITTYLAAAVKILRSGRIAPRSVMDANYNDMRLALRADRESYLRSKTIEFRQANQPLSNLWDVSI